MEFKIFVESTNDHVVFAGSCVGKSSSFCEKQVENSVCNLEKNECFCKRGYVAIKEEEDKVSCKTLLTDLKCRMDRDCYHVNKSTCHPGAGYCSCPGHTIYSSELHACRVKSSHIENIQFCIMCRTEEGMCFIYEEYDKRSSFIRTETGYLGCACPNKKIINSEKHVEICISNQVDIGDYCDNSKDICRSKKAICEEKSTSNQIKVCQCPKDHLKLYQTNLNYHECFPILSENSPLCSLCITSKGTCYDINDDGIGDGCQCPMTLSNPTSTAEFKHQNEFCTIRNLESSCEEENLKVCYKPHVRPPYEYLEDDLLSNKAVVQLKGGYNHKSNHGCLLNYVEEDKKFCVKINLIDQARECGMRSYKIAHNKLQYEIILEVLNNRSFKNPSKDIQFPISCTIKEPTRTTSPIQNTIPSNIRGLKKLWKSDEFNVGLQVLDSNNNEVESVEEGSIIKLDVSLIDPSGNFKAISVEECYFSNDSRLENVNSLLDKSILLIKKGCPVVREGFMANFRSYVMPGIHIQSDGFHAFKLSTHVNSLFIDCFIKVCKTEVFCWQIDCNKTPQRNSQISTEKAQFKIVRRQTHLNILRKRRYKNIKDMAKPGIGKCLYAVCLTALQTSVMAALLLTLIFLIIVIIYVIYRKNRIYHEHNKLTQQSVRGPFQSPYPTCHQKENNTNPVRHRCVSNSIPSPEDATDHIIQLPDYIHTPVHTLQLLNDYELESIPVISHGYLPQKHSSSTIPRKKSRKCPLQDVKILSETVTRV